MLKKNDKKIKLYKHDDAIKDFKIISYKKHKLVTGYKGIIYEGIIYELEKESVTDEKKKDIYDNYDNTFFFITYKTERYDNWFISDINKINLFISE
jgi:hypothetical protein